MTKVHVRVQGYRILGSVSGGKFVWDETREAGWSQLGVIRCDSLCRRLEPSRRVRMYERYLLSYSRTTYRCWMEALR